MKMYWGNGGTDPRMLLNLGTRCRSVVSLTPLPLYRRGRSPRYRLGTGLGGPQSQELNIRHPARSLISILTELPWHLFTWYFVNNFLSE
jgi:hypothetical protein